MKPITYTEGQEKGSLLFGQFYINPNENVMILKGYSGTGKSTLVKRLLGEIPKLDEMCKMLSDSYRPYDIALTATTNQAAEALAMSINFVREVTTIHKYLGLRVHTVDYVKRIKELRATRREKRERILLFIDECSYIDRELMRLIHEETEDCKIVFIGDPAQLTPVKSSYMPAFEMNRNEIELTELVRFDDGPISNLVSALRRTVLEGVWPNFSEFITPGIFEKVDRFEFDRMTQAAFLPDSGMGKCKILAYTNDCVIGYNNRLSAKYNGSSDPLVGQIMVNNEECNNGAERVANNIEVIIEEVEPASRFGYPGWEVKLMGKSGVYFMPANCRTARDAAHKEAVRNDNFDMMKEVVDAWIDLRPSYACTGNKSQGSTYDTIFVDLGNVLTMVRGGDQLARLLYVMYSRARSRIISVGDKRG